MSGHQLSVLPTYDTPVSSGTLPNSSRSTPSTAAPSTYVSAVPPAPASTVPSTAASMQQTVAPPAASSASHAPSGTSSTAASPATVPGPSQAPAEDHDPIPPAGYPKLAVQMGLMPEVAIFRRFGFLNAQNILYMQAELVSLEERLRKLQVKDNSTLGPKSKYARSWFRLRESADDGDTKQLKLVRQIRRLLKEYNEALIQQIKIVSVDPPSAYDLRYVQRYLASRDMEGGFLIGKDADVWGSVEKPGERAPDLLSLLPRHNEDFFSKWVTESAVEKVLELNQGRKPSTTRNVVGYEDDTVLRWTFVFASALASALPILSIVILYCVKSLKVRLGLIAVFNVLLSFSLAAFTSAKRADIFAVSAAFSAVQVVFVQVGTNDTQVGVT